MIRDRRPNRTSNYKSVLSEQDKSDNTLLQSFNLKVTDILSATAILFRPDQIALNRAYYPGPGSSPTGSTFNQTVIPDNNPLFIRENLPDYIISGPLLPGYTNDATYPSIPNTTPFSSESSSSSSSNSFSSSSTSRTASESSSSSSNSKSSSESSSRSKSSSSSGIPSSSSSTSISFSTMSTSSDSSQSILSNSSDSTSSNEEFTSSSSNTFSSSSSVSTSSSSSA